jgi:poly-gamma-glutamate synthesis protein (capsule biosynthesis protein)
VATSGLARDPRRPPERELEISVGDGFTLAVVGDVIASRPLAPARSRDAGFAAAAGVLAGSTVALGNLETSLVDIRGFRGAPRNTEDWAMVGTPAVAADLAALGLRLVARANNHAVDWGREGLLETSAHLDGAGVVHAGAGESLAAAVAPRYLETALGRVGLVSVTTATRGDGSLALDAFGETPPRPGVAGIRLDRVVTVTPSTFAELERILRRLDPTGMGLELRGPTATGASLSLFGSTFVVGDEPSVTYVSDGRDVAVVERAVRLGAQHADLLVVSVHCHEEGPDEDTPPRALVELAHGWVDAGAAVVFGHGVHRLWPVERYRGRPILYGLGNLVMSDLQEALPRALYEEAGALAVPTLPTDADVNATLNAQGFDDQRFFDSVIATVAFDGAEPSVRLYPVELGYGRRLTESGVPRLASGDDAERILGRVAAMSEPFGLVATIDGDVGTVGAAAGSRADHR